MKKVVLIPASLMDKIRQKAIADNFINALDDEALVLWVLENYLDE